MKPLILEKGSSDKDWLVRSPILSLRCFFPGTSRVPHILDLASAGTPHSWVEKFHFAYPPRDLNPGQHSTESVYLPCIWLEYISGTEHAFSLPSGDLYSGRGHEDTISWGGNYRNCINSCNCTKRPWIWLIWPLCRAVWSGEGTSLTRPSQLERAF